MTQHIKDEKWQKYTIQIKNQTVAIARVEYGQLVSVRESFATIQRMREEIWDMV